MEIDRTKWNIKHRNRPEMDKPSKIVMEFCKMAKNGRALDIACGTGRNAIYLAHKVLPWMPWIFPMWVLKNSRQTPANSTCLRRP
jgi:hypothetical protein